MSRAVTPFVIVADHRTGSTLLASSLDAAPMLRCRGELFHERDFSDNQVPGLDRHAAEADAILDRAFAASEEGVLAAGFRALISHPPPSRPAWKNLWRCLARVDGLRVIYLQRRDRLAQYASLLVASQTGVFHPSPECPEPPERPRVQVERASFLRWLAETDAQRAACERALQHRPALFLGYEELAGAWGDTLSSVQRFLGVPRRELPQRKQKLETRPLEEVIVNYEQARALLERWSARAQSGAPVWTSVDLSR